MRLSHWCLVAMLVLVLCGCSPNSPGQRLAGRWGGDAIIGGSPARLTLALHADGTFSGTEMVIGDKQTTQLVGRWSIEPDGRTVDFMAQGASMGVGYEIDGNRLRRAGDSQSAGLSRLHWWQPR